MLSSMGRPKEHGDRTRAALLDAATEILGKEGISAVSVRRVADQAGTTTRAVYALFQDKDGLLRALFRVAAETMRRHHEAVPPDADPIRELHALAAAYRAGAHEQPYLYSLFVGTRDAKPTEDDLAVAFRSLERVLETVRRAIAWGLMPGRDPEAIGRQLWATVHGLASLELGGFLGEPDDAAAHWRDTMTVCLLGYTKSQADAEATMATTYRKIAASTRPGRRSAGTAGVAPAAPKKPR
jgi:AcrR family transcriptional regulator